VTITATVKDADGRTISPILLDDAGKPKLDADGKQKPNNQGLVDWRVSKDLDDVIAHSEEGNKIIVIGLSSQSAKLVGNYAPIIAQVKSDAGQVAVLNIRLSKALAPGPIPPGLDPQVDLMWAVVPMTIVGDNFGRAMRKKFYAIEVVIGNNTGYDLQIASVGFEGAKGPEIDPKTGKWNGKWIEIDHVAPSTGFKMARGSSERAKQLYPRNLALNTIRALGPVLVGFTPFFHNIGHRSNFTEGINIFSNPVEKAFDLIVPDLSIEELNRLQDAIIRDDNMTRTVIPNNTQARTVVLVAKDLLGLTKEQGRDVPLRVMQALGSLVLVGQKVQYLNRERVVAQPATKAEYGISGKIIDECNNGIPGVTLNLTGPADFPQRSVKTNEDGRFSFGLIPSSDKYVVTPKLGDNDKFIPTNGSTDPKDSGQQAFTLDEDKIKTDFTAKLEKYSVSGRITLKNGTLADLSSFTATGSKNPTAVPISVRDDGTFNQPLAPDQYVLKVGAKAGTNYSFSLVGGIGDLTTGKQIDLSKCNQRDFNFTATKQ
jgi:hypothetical protein